MKQFLRVYKNLLFKFPIGTQSVQTGLLMGLGDVIAQLGIEKKPFQNIDVVRAGKFTVVGSIFVGPPLRLWYGAMDKFFTTGGKIIALKKVTADQLLFAPFFLGGIMAVLSVAQGNTLTDVKLRLSQDYLDVLISNYKLWPVVQLVNFYIIPLNFQVPVVQIVAIFWNSYLSWKMNQDIH